MAHVEYEINSFERYLAKKLEDPEFRRLYEIEKDKVTREIRKEFDKRNSKTSS